MGGHDTLTGKSDIAPLTTKAAFDADSHGSALFSTFRFRTGDAGAVGGTVTAAIADTLCKQAIGASFLGCNDAFGNKFDCAATAAGAAFTANGKGHGTGACFCIDKIKTGITTSAANGLGKHTHRILTGGGNISVMIHGYLTTVAAVTGCAAKGDLGGLGIGRITKADIKGRIAAAATYGLGQQSMALKTMGADSAVIIDNNRIAMTGMTACAADGQLNGIGIGGGCRSALVAFQLRNDLIKIGNDTVIDFTPPWV